MVEGLLVERLVMLLMFILEALRNLKKNFLQKLLRSKEVDGVGWFTMITLSDLNFLALRIKPVHGQKIVDQF